MKLYFAIVAAVAALTLFCASAYVLLLQNTTPDVYVNTPISQPKPDPEPQENTVTFLAVGDIMLSREVAKKMAAQHNDGLYPFQNMATVLTETDFNVGNLESPFSGTDTQDPNPNTFTFNAPTWAAAGLQQYNFKLLSVANNHALNQGKAGLMFTKSHLAGLGIKTVGGGETPDEAWQSQVITRDGIKIGFLGATYAPASSYLAQVTDLTRLQTAVTKLKDESDFIVVMMHAGTEYVREPNGAQTKFAHAAIDAGADMIIGSHPHWVQPIENYKGKYIFYSLGNFVFDQMWSPDTTQGLTAKITLHQAKDDKIVSVKEIQLLPVIIENYSQPRPANETETKMILQKIKAQTSLIVPST